MGLIVIANVSRTESLTRIRSWGYFYLIKNILGIDTFYLSSFGYFQILFVVEQWLSTIILKLETEHENGKETETEDFFSFPFLFQAYVLLKFHDLSTMLRIYKKYHSNSCPVPVPSKLNTIYRNYYIFHIITHTGPHVLFQFRILVFSSRPNYRFVLFFFYLLLLCNLYDWECDMV